MRKLTHNGENIVYIEYINSIPTKVETAPIDGGLTTFDFEFVYGDRKDIRYYESGMGGSKTSLQAPHFIPNSKSKFQYWMADGAKFKKGTRAKNCQRIDKPLRVFGWRRRSSINPFLISDETSYGFEYCSVCNQTSCDGEGCRDHMTWSDEESCFIYDHDGSRVE